MLCICFSRFVLGNVIPAVGEGSPCLKSCHHVTMLLLTAVIPREEVGEVLHVWWPPKSIDSVKVVAEVSSQRMFCLLKTLELWSCFVSK